MRHQLILISLLVTGTANGQTLLDVAAILADTDKSLSWRYDDPKIVRTESRILFPPHRNDPPFSSVQGKYNGFLLQFMGLESEEFVSVPDPQNCVVSSRRQVVQDPAKKAAMRDSLMKQANENFPGASGAHLRSQIQELFPKLTQQYSETTWYLGKVILDRSTISFDGREYVYRLEGADNVFCQRSDIYKISEVGIVVDQSNLHPKERCSRTMTLKVAPELKDRFDRMLNVTYSKFCKSAQPPSGKF